MPQLNLPRKLVSTIQMWASTLLIVLAFVFSLMPVITLETNDMAADITNGITDMFPNADLDDFEIPEEIGVSAPKLISSVSTIVKSVSLLASASDTDMTDEKAEKLAKQAEELEAYLETEKGREDIITAVSIAFAAVNVFEPITSGADLDIFSVVFQVLISMIGFFAVIALTVAIPVMLFFKALAAVIRALKNITTPEEVCTKSGASLADMLSIPFTVMLFQCVVPGMTYAFGLVMVCVLAIISVVVNFACSRMREYPLEQFKYLNILQGPALVGIVGFLVFFFNIVNSNVLTTFTHGSFAKYMTSIAAIFAVNEEAEVQNGYLVDGILMLVYVALMLACVSYLNKAARRFSCTVKKDRPRGIAGLFYSGRLKDNHVIAAIFTLAVYIIPTYIAGEKNYYQNPLSTEAVGDGSFLELGTDSEKALTGALIGIIIMIIAEISVIVLKRVFCKNLSRDDREALMTGKAKTSDEKLAEAKKIVADAEAVVAEAEAAVAAEVVEAVEAVEENTEA